MTYQITKEQLLELISQSFDAGVYAEKTCYSPDESYQNLMYELIGENWDELDDDRYDFEQTTHYYLYVCCNIMTPEFKEFIDAKKQELNELNGLNNCDCCGKVDDTNKLYWTEHDLEDKSVLPSVFEYDAICENCLESFIESK